jgi:hydroxymethylglutaryl-CoA synthase
MNQRIGIEAMALCVPARYLEMEDLAQARGVDPQKYAIGLGAKQMALTDPGEDTVALAATAARRLFDRHRIDPERIGLLICGTETGVDHSKPVASYVQGLLELPHDMRTYDVQHACYGGTAGLMTAIDWIASGSNAGRAAVVIAADIARYGLRTPGEPTQGAGAVAMLVSNDPRLLEIDRPAMTGMFSDDVHDFWRPHGRREAVVDGHYSVDCYLEALDGAYRGWRKKALERGLVRWSGGLASDGLAHVAYHVPFCKMAQKAHAKLRAADLAEVGRPLDPEAEKMEAVRGARSFEAQVAPTLVLPSRIGNAYTASLYIGLLGLFSANDRALPGRRIGLFSYGSGCASEFFSGVAGPDAASPELKAEIDRLLDSRERVSIAEYEHWMNTDPVAPPTLEPRPGTYRFAGIDAHRRLYLRG